MPIADAGFNDSHHGPGGELLRAIGPGLMVLVGPRRASPGAPTIDTTGNAVPPPPFQSVPALIDTGAAESCIDQSLADELVLPLVDRRVYSGAGGRHELNVYLAVIVIPVLGMNQSGLFGAVRLRDGGSPHRVLLGRTLLRGTVMVYDGRSGRVTLSI